MFGEATGPDVVIVPGWTDGAIGRVVVDFLVPDLRDAGPF